MSANDTKISPNRLGAVLRYFADAVGYAKAGAAGRLPPIAEPPRAAAPSHFRPQLESLAAQYYPAGELVDAAELWRLAVLSPWLGPNLQLIANRLTAVPLEIKRRKGERLEDVPNHPIERLLANPNPLWPGVLIWQYGVAWHLLRGNAFWFLATPAPGQGEPQEVWALDSSQVRPRPDLIHQGRGVFKNRPIIDYELTIQGRVFPLPGENVIHWRTPNPFDYWEGLSPLNAATQGLQIDHAQAAWLHGFYGEDNAVPTAIISLPPEIDDPTFEAAKDEIREQFSQKRRSAVTRAGDLTVQVIEQALKDMEMVASREFNGKLLDRIYGIPEGLISGGLSGDSRLAAEVAFARNTIQPLLTSLASALDARLTPYWGDENLVLSAPNITPQDRALDMQEFTLHSPFLTVNEARELIGKKAYDHDLAAIPLRLLDLIAKEGQGDAGTEGDAGTGGDGRYGQYGREHGPTRTDTDDADPPPAMSGADAPGNIAEREAQKASSFPLSEPGALAAVADELIAAAGVLGATLKHYGPGDHPNGSPQSVHAGLVTVGMTSFGFPQDQPHATHTVMQTHEAMQAFADQLRSLPGVDNVSVQIGQGGWRDLQTGVIAWEPSWVVTYRGNGQALALLRSTGRHYDQQAILLIRPGKKDFLTDIDFEKNIPGRERRDIEQALINLGVEGWTWHRTQEGHSALRMVNVSRWGATLTPVMINNLETYLRQHSYTFLRQDDTAKVGVMIL